MVQKKKKDRSGLRYILRLTQPGGSRDRSEGVSLSDESLRLRWIRNAIGDLMMDVWAGPFPGGKNQFRMNDWVERVLLIQSQYQRFLDKIGRKAWTNLILGDEKAAQLRDELAWLKEQAEHSSADPKIVSLWEMVRDLKLVQEYQDYTPDYEKYWAVTEQDRADLKEHETWHRADDGTMDEDRFEKGIQIPYRWDTKGEPETFVNALIRKEEQMQVWINVVKSQKQEKLLGIYYRKGQGPGMPYRTLGRDAETLLKAGHLDRARVAYDLYFKYKLAMNQRSADIRTALCGRVHVHFMQMGDYCVWSPIVKADRVAKSKPNTGIPDEFYRD